MGLSKTTPPKTKIENAAWKMTFPFTKVPFLGTFVHFQGCNMKNLSLLIGSLDSEIRILLDCSKSGKSTRHLPTGLHICSLYVCPRHMCISRCE